MPSLEGTKAAYVRALGCFDQITIDARRDDRHGARAHRQRDLGRAVGLDRAVAAEGDHPGRRSAPSCRPAATC